jgi:hypothetical protein
MKIVKRRRRLDVTALARHYGMPSNWRDVVADLDWSEVEKEELELMMEEERRNAEEAMERAQTEEDGMDWDPMDTGPIVKVEEEQEEGEEQEQEAGQEAEGSGNGKGKGKAPLLLEGRTEKDEDEDA